MTDSTEHVEHDNTPNHAEEEARVFGWVPQEEFKGNPDDWRDAETFLARGKEINGFLRKDLTKLQREIEKRDQRLAEIQQTIEEFSKYHAETEKRAVEKAIERLKADKKAAIAAGDGELVIEIEDQMEELKTIKNKPAPQPKQETKEEGVSEEVFTSWVEENEWYRKDKALQAAANGMADLVRADHPTLVGKPFLDKVKEYTKDAFPEKFSNKRGISPVEGSNSNSPGGTRKKTFADLPPEAQAACIKFEKQGLLKREQYITEYFS
jgi:hypothetical protein